MNFLQTVAGQRQKWSLVNKLGEGDAGEVYLVESLLEGRRAILKRPRKSPLSTDTLRQAAQIRTEGSLLKALSGISFQGAGIHLCTPAFIDQSPPEEGTGERFFIVIERAAGFDLRSLLHLVHSGQAGEVDFPPSEENRFFIEKFSKFGHIPAPILIRGLHALIHLLETIHFSEVLNEGTRQSGLIWNDIKPDHLYWDPQEAHLTVIDWGNGKFLEADGATKDRQHSRIDDDYQFMQAMGAFLAEANPDLYARLEWPQEIFPGNAYTHGIQPLKEKLAILHAQALEELQDLRNAASSLYATSRPGLEHLDQSDELHRRSLGMGIMPDFASAVNFQARVALQAASENRLDTFKSICERTARLPSAAREKWELLGEFAGELLDGIPSEDAPPGLFSNALVAGVADDWASLLWEMFQYFGSDPLPEWWERLARGIRRVHLKMDPDALTPSIAINRLFYSLSAAVTQMVDKLPARLPLAGEPHEDQLRQYQDLLKNFNEEVLKQWKEFEPAPPHSGIGYQEIGGLLAGIEALLPGTQEKIEQVFTQPKAHAEIVLNAWERKDFETARRALRALLIWDPDRRRLLSADQAIAAASQWLGLVRAGAANDEPFYDFLTRAELAGRSLRNRVGPAHWLDIILDALRRLRKGTRPADLIMEHPDILNEIPWLNEFRSREVLSLPRSRALTPERDALRAAPVRTLSGVVEGRLGADQDLSLAGALDVWVPEARGSSARVFTGLARSQTGKPLPLAVKIMRPDQVEYALPLFREEAHILSLMRDVPGVTPLVECGFLQLMEGVSLPAEEGQASAGYVRGSLVRYGGEDVQNFLASMDRYLAQGWLPYLALVRRDQQHNLLRYCDAGSTHGWFLPLQECLLLGIQICDILQSAHDRNIVYRDHKILHYYWDPEAHGVVMIDWNIAKRQSQGLSEAERQFDLVQFGARALHHILTGRPAPGALPLGPNRPEEIEHASLNYTVNWTYDDERLPNRVKEIMEQVLKQGYSHVRDLRADLLQVYQQAPDPATESH